MRTTVSGTTGPSRSWRTPTAAVVERSGAAVHQHTTRGRRPQPCPRQRSTPSPTARRPTTPPHPHPNLTGATSRRSGAGVTSGATASKVVVASKRAYAVGTCLRSAAVDLDQENAAGTEGEGEGATSRRRRRREGVENERTDPGLKMIRVLILSCSIYIRTTSLLRLYSLDSTGPPYSIACYHFW